jgi:hypothetical protein
MRNVKILDVLDEIEVDTWVLQTEQKDLGRVKKISLKK